MPQGLFVDAQDGLEINVYGEKMNADGTIELYPPLFSFELDDEHIRECDIVNLIICVEKRTKPDTPAI
ncbi:MAG: hypothetical protein JRJ66_02280 [Deltaproteobacteria bacterium]|nr:hypothetical protein [Deltaproteobacteria bacterium]